MSASPPRKAGTLVEDSAANNRLLAVDLGLRCGMAMYGPTGRLLWYRSQHFGSVPALRRAASRELCGAGAGSWLLSEGDVRLAALWERIAMRQGVRVQRVSAEIWRDSVLYPRQRQDATEAKRQAEILARRVIRWSQAKAPTSLRHDAAEAILIGLWGVIQLGWLRAIPADVCHTAEHIAQMSR